MPAGGARYGHQDLDSSGSSLADSVAVPFTTAAGVGDVPDDAILVLTRSSGIAAACADRSTPNAELAPARGKARIAKCRFIDFLFRCGLVDFCGVSQSGATVSVSSPAAVLIDYVDCTRVLIPGRSSTSVSGIADAVPFMSKPNKAARIAGIAKFVFLRCLWKRRLSWRSTPFRLRRLRNRYCRVQLPRPSRRMLFAHWLRVRSGPVASRQILQAARAPHRLHRSPADQRSRPDRHRISCFGPFAFLLSG